MSIGYAKGKPECIAFSPTRLFRALTISWWSENIQLSLTFSLLQK